MGLKLYYDLFSQPSRAIYIFLKVNKIPFESVPIALRKGEHKTEAYKKINPLQLVPVIDDNGHIVRESVGILRYLTREKSVPDHWYPKESRAQSKVDEFLEWQHLGLRLPCMVFFRTMILKPLITKQEPLESDIAKAKREMIHYCNIFENVWLKDDSKFLFGEEMTIADLIAAVELDQPRIAGYDPKEGRPKLSVFMKHVKQVTDPYYKEANVIVNKLINKFEASK